MASTKPIFHYFYNSLRWQHPISKTINNMTFKDLAREFLISFHLDLTKNIKYDRLTRKVMKQVINSNSNCIDIGCHKGEILRSMIRLAPDGKHFAFEPIPEMYKSLTENFSEKSTIYPFALSDKSGKTKFQYVKNAPAYSGIKKRKYDVEEPDIEEIEVEMKSLDELISENTEINLIKIDVEGGEFAVLNGAKKLLRKQKPVVIFEYGLGASDYYGTKPSDIYNLIVNDTGLNIFTLDDFLSGRIALDEEKFIHLYNTNKEYYFIAAPEQK